MFVLAVDPGRGKFGWALVSRKGTVLEKGVAPSGEVVGLVRELLTRYSISWIALGDRTGSGEFGRILSGISDRYGFSLIEVDEDCSTLEGRKRYFEENPPRGIRRLLPVSLQVPPEPYDDYVAVVLAERFLENL